MPVQLETTARVQADREVTARPERHEFGGHGRWAADVDVGQPVPRPGSSVYGSRNRVSGTRSTTANDTSSSTLTVRPYRSISLTVARDQVS